MKNFSKQEYNFSERLINRQIDNEFNTKVGLE